MAERLKAHVLKTCLGNTNVGSNPTPSAVSCKFACGQVFRLHHERVHIQTWELSNSTLGRCQSGRMGPPAKRLLGRNPQSQVRILSSPPQHETRPSGRVLFSAAGPRRGDGIRILPSGPRHNMKHVHQGTFCFQPLSSQKLEWGYFRLNFIPRWDFRIPVSHRTGAHRP